jgi:hypothetical protein
VSRTKYKRRSNRSAKILATLFSIMIVLSLVLSLVGSLFDDSSQPEPTYTSSAPPTSTPTPLPGADNHSLEATSTSSP